MFGLGPAAAPLSPASLVPRNAGGSDKGRKPNNAPSADEAPTASSSPTSLLEDRARERIALSPTADATSFKDEIQPKDSAFVADEEGYNARKAVEAQAEAAARLQEKFERTASRLQHFFQAEDLVDPPGPKEIQERVVELAQQETGAALWSKTTDLTDPPKPKPVDKEPERPALDVFI